MHQIEVGVNIVGGDISYDAGVNADKLIIALPPWNRSILDEINHLLHA
ncbi:hypothetical protein SJI19_17695 [Acerihabitans sp. TG2]|nr:hypothetical protein [Acerihabitans sp. TG2]MEA9392353.1 hypothetical protein [Acerihabitans sp. TG2]